uniref:26S proteasome non-ATPase regulatory subunit 8 n=1 Tax=Elaeophora elaphi TaxID=1147741 RepID=A0A0R3S2P4_9BILA
MSDCAQMTERTTEEGDGDDNDGEGRHEMAFAILFTCLPIDIEIKIEIENCMARLDGVHQRLLDEWRQESKRDLSQLEMVLKSAEMEVECRKLVAEWNKGPKNLGVIGVRLNRIKELMNNRNALRGLSHHTLLTIHRDVFEIDALYAILRSDLDSFREAIAALISFYNSYGSNEEWPNKWLMIGLDLMFLLATNQHTQFHMLLEQIDQDIQQKNPYIKTPVKLEQSLIEGAYHKIMLAEKNIPSPYYALFIRISMDTVRDEIASCMERAFIKISQRDAAQLLLFDDINEMISFAEKRGWKNSTYDRSVTYVFDHAQQTLVESRVDTKRIAKQAIHYAKQLEMIV